MLIAVSGNMGVGKSTLVARLADDLGWVPAFEPVQNNSLLEKAYADRKKHNFDLQMFYLEQRIRVHREFQEKEGVFLLDRSIYEGAEIFLRVQLRLGMVTQKEYDLYQERYRRVLPELKAPQLMVGLQTSMPHLIAQIQKRGRAFEVSADPSYFEELQKEYEIWLKDYSLGAKVLIDNEQFNYADREEDFQTVKQLLLSVLQQSLHIRPSEGQPLLSAHYSKRK